MKRGREVVSRFIKSFLLPRSYSSRLLYFQASQYPHFFFTLLSSSLSSSSTSSHFTSQQKLYFSAAPRSIVDLVITNEWSEDLENDLLEKFDSTPLTHEAVVYIMKSLAKFDKSRKKVLNFLNWACDKHGFRPNSIVCNLMLVILSTTETRNEFEDFLRKMSEEGFDVEERTYGIICSRRYFTKLPTTRAKDASRSIADVILQAEGNLDLKELEKFKSFLLENTIMRVFYALRVNPLKALLFFLWLKESAGYTHNAVTYNGLLRIICKKELVQEFWDVVKEMRGAGYEMDLDTYVLISKQFAKMKMVEDLVQLYEVVMDGAYKAPITCCRGILKEIANNTLDINLVARVVETHEAAGYALNKGVYTNVYRCLAFAGRFMEADKVLEAMRKAGFLPDKEIYGYALFGLGKAGKLEEAMDMLDEMEAKGLVPDLHTWSALIRGQCTGNEIDQAFRCYAMMLEKNMEVGANILDVLVNGLCTKRRVDCAFSLFTEAVSMANTRPFYATYSSLLHNLLRDRKLEEGIDLLHLMRKHKYPAIIDPFVDYISKFGTVGNAMKLLEGLSKRQSLSNHSHVLQAFLKEGRQSEAREFLEACPHDIRNHAEISEVFASPKPRNAPI